MSAADPTEPSPVQFALLAWRRWFAPADWRGPTAPLLLIWLICMIAMPITEWLWGEQALLAGVVVTVLLQAGLVVLLLAHAISWRRAVLTALAVVLIAWSAEAIGVATGFPFGPYHYTARLQPQLAGVPLLIPLAWLMMLPPTWAVAQQIAGRQPVWRWALSSALAFTAWDLFLDPQMVHWELWTWDTSGQYFGIPFVNFVGWLAVSAVLSLITRPPALPHRALATVYALTWLTETVGLILFWGLYGPAVAGCAGMGLFVWLGRRSLFPAKG